MLTQDQQHLVSQHINQANRCAKWWRKRDKQISFEDFKQEALLGLVVAATHYKVDENRASFSSYAFSFMHGAVKKMRSAWYTGKRYGFEKNMPVPVWVLLDHPNQDDSEDEGNWYAKHCGITLFNPALREQIFNMNIPTVEDKELSKQRDIASYIMNIKAIMKENKITITALAKKVGVSQPTMSRWLNNTVGLNSESKCKIDTALNQMITI